MKTNSFERFSLHQSDAYIVDYTHQTKHTPVKRGVELHKVKPTDIDGLFLDNQQQIRFKFVNFEEKENLLLQDELPIKQCECMCVSEEELKEKKWLMLAELKYCECKNVRPNLQKAFGQLMSTFNYLTDRQVISRLHKTYLIISLPLQSNAPFEHFVFSPNQLSEMRKRYKVIVRGVNKVSIISASKLKV